MEHALSKILEINPVNAEKSTCIANNKLQTPGDDSSFEDVMRMLSSVEDFDEHPVHVVSLDSVPEE